MAIFVIAMVSIVPSALILALWTGAALLGYGTPPTPDQAEGVALVVLVACETMMGVAYVILNP